MRPTFISLVVVSSCICQLLAQDVPPCPDPPCKVDVRMTGWSAGWSARLSARSGGLEGVLSLQRQQVVGRPGVWLVCAVIEPAERPQLWIGTWTAPGGFREIRTAADRPVTEAGVVPTIRRDGLAIAYAAADGGSPMWLTRRSAEDSFGEPQRIPLGMGAKDVRFGRHGGRDGLYFVRHGEVWWTACHQDSVADAHRVCRLVREGHCRHPIPIGDATGETVALAFLVHRESYTELWYVPDLTAAVPELMWRTSMSLAAISGNTGVIRLLDAGRGENRTPLVEVRYWALGVVQHGNRIRLRVYGPGSAVVCLYESDGPPPKPPGCPTPCYPEPGWSTRVRDVAVVGVRTGEAEFDVDLDRLRGQRLSAVVLTAAGDAQWATNTVSIPGIANASLRGRKSPK